MAQLENLKTISEIAAFFNVKPWQINYATVSGSRIDPTQTAGHLRLYDATAIRQISSELDRINAKKNPSKQAVTA